MSERVPIGHGWFFGDECEAPRFPVGEYEPVRLVSIPIGIGIPWDVTVEFPDGSRQHCYFSQLRHLGWSGLYEACKRAVRFIENGTEFGYIQFPHPQLDDSANETLPMLRAAIAKAEGR